MEGQVKPGTPAGKKGSTGQSPGGEQGDKGGGATSLAKGKPGTSAGPSEKEGKETPGAADKSGPNGAGLGKTKGDKVAKPGKEQKPEPGKPGHGQGIADAAPPPNTPPGGAGHPTESSQETLAKLFQPQTAPAGNKPPDDKGAAAGGSQEGPMAGSSTKLGQSGKAPDLKDVDSIADPVEREAARKLQQAVQRIKANRDRRVVPARSGKGDATATDTRRDW
jgi:hypothetical protein